MKHPNESKDNTNITAKISIRQELLSLLDQPIVLDMFCGEGHIYESCYKDKCVQYLGLDDTKVHNPDICIICDNEQYVNKNDVSEFNVYDSDAYGNGWKLAMLCAKQTKSSQFVIFITDGLDNNLRIGGQVRFVRSVLGIPRKMKVPAMTRWHNLFVVRCIRLIEIYSGSKLIKGLHSDNGKETKYFGLLFKKT